MEPKFNINRPKVSDEEIKQHQDFDKLVKQFKEQSLKKARGDESWWRNKKIQYSAVIAGITVVCTVTYLSIASKQKQNTSKHETLTTQSTKSTPGPSKSYVAPPSADLNVKYTSYTVNPTQPTDLRHPSGTRIRIPKNAFVDKNGKTITGEVSIEYREFHDAAEIIASGIPMHYDSAGSRRQFESAGMFDIRGQQNGQPVFIHPEQRIKVELVSQSNQNKFCQYYLDTAGRNWQFLGPDKIDSLQKKRAATVTAVNMSPKNTPALNRLKEQNEIILPRRLDSLNATYTKRVQKLPMPVQPNKPAKQTPGKPTFVIDGNQQDFPELSAFDNVVFEVGAENKNYSKELHDITWSDVKISEGPVKGKNYLLTLIYRQRKEQLIVYPVLAGKDYEKASRQYAEQLALYEKKKEQREAEEKRLLAEMASKQAALLELQKKQEEELKKEREKLAARYDLQLQQEVTNNFKNMSIQARAMRTFEVARFGIFNSDCALPVPEGTQMVPVFVLNGKPLHPKQVYVVCYTNNQVIALNKDVGFRFGYNSNQAYSFCVFDKNRAYVCNKKSFEESAAGGSNKFEVKSISVDIDNLPDLRKALEI